MHMVQKEARSAAPLAWAAMTLFSSIAVVLHLAARVLLSRFGAFLPWAAFVHQVRCKTGSVYNNGRPLLISDLIYGRPYQVKDNFGRDWPGKPASPLDGISCCVGCSCTAGCVAKCTVS
jgi:hypothetical protein